MSSAFCYMCIVDPLGESKDSNEHIIPQSLGSPLCSKGILCAIHNNLLGETVDSELFNQIGHLADMMGVNLRSKNKIITGYTNDNQEFTTSSGTKGAVEIVVQLKHNKYKISGNNESEVRKKVKSLLKKHKKSIGNVEDALRQADDLDFKDTYPPGREVRFKNYLTEDPTEARFVLNPRMIKAFIKIALNFHFLKGFVEGAVKPFIEILNKEDEEVKPSPHIVRMIIETHFSRPLEEKEISHALHLKGSKELGYYVCYIELFSMFHVIVSFDTFYDGPEIDESWGIDLISGKTFSPKVDLKFNQQQLLDMQFNSDNTTSSLTVNYERLVTIFNGISKEQNRQEEE